jgi:hypothetical protein
MTVNSELEAPAESSAPATVEDLFRCVASVNPFTDNRVNAPAESRIHVENIHAFQLAKLISLAQEACTTGRGLGAILWGEAGIGKSHLLARLAAWASQDRRAWLVYLHNLQAAPAHLPRSLLQAVISVLTWGRVENLHETELFRLVNAFLREALGDGARDTYSWSIAASAYDRLVDSLSRADPWRAALVDRTVYQVLFRFYRSAYLAHEGEDDESAARAALRWLAGDWLDPDEAGLLGLRPGLEGATRLEDNQQIKLVLVALCRMAQSRPRAFILCFDQVDNLDTEQAAALARFLEALLDSAPNLLVVLAGVQASLLRWRADKVFQDSAWDRIGQFQVHLQRVSVPAGQAMVKSRLDHFFEPFGTVQLVRQRRELDPLFPLGQAWADEFLGGKIEVRPRDVLNWAREGWQREQEALRQLGSEGWLAGASRSMVPRKAGLLEGTIQQNLSAIDSLVSEKIRELKGQRLAEPHTLPASAENLAGLVHSLLEQCIRIGDAYPLRDTERPRAPGRGARVAYDLIVTQRTSAVTHSSSASGESEEVEGCSGRIGLLFLATPSASATTVALRRLASDCEPPERVFLITDQRQPLHLAARGNDYLGELRNRGPDRFRSLEVSLEDYAELHALSGVVALGRSGDLEVPLAGGGQRPVSERVVMEAYRRLGCYRSAPILRELVTTFASAGCEAPVDGIRAAD